MNNRNTTAQTIGLATNWNYPDYGGMLQSFASQTTIQNLGYNVEVIDARPLDHDITRRKLTYFARNIFDLSIVKEKSAVVATKFRSKMDSSFLRRKRERDAAFEKFCMKNFDLSSPAVDWATLTDLASCYDAVVVGSDQLWLPSNITADYYTLSFVPNNVPKIAYATSFGIPSIPNYLFETTRNYLKRFDFLSAREITGQQIIEKCTGRKVPLVCDPTLLLGANQWANYAADEKCPNENYIFCYLMGDNQKHRTYIQEISRLTGWKIVALLHLDRYIASDEDFPDYAPFDISPSEFLGLIANASLVCTDSFHGTIFSAQFNSPFLVFRRFVKKTTLSTNTRIDSLLDRLDLQKHLVNDFSDTKHSIEMSEKLENLDTRITSFRNDSLEYLRNALGTHA